MIINKAYNLLIINNLKNTLKFYMFFICINQLLYCRFVPESKRR